MYDKIAELYDLFYDWKDYRAESEKFAHWAGIATRSRRRCSTSRVAPDRISFTCASGLRSRAPT